MRDLAGMVRTLKAHMPELSREFGVKKAGIFGSYARGEQVGNSDLDVLVEFRSPIGLFRFMDLEERLRRLLGVKVDLVSVGALKPRIGRCILREVVFV
ncbi:MAG: nucleotidyltransferase family protein [Elusimicrobia bacterium]|nr:nucleotidyltransferase family protein [Elusimicrobiota bacterium]